MMQRGLTIVAAFGLGLALLGGCGGGSATPAVTVTMAEYSFTPRNISVPHNGTLKLVNDGRIAHSFVMPTEGVGTGSVAPGQSTTLSLKGIATGTYRVVCDIPGHVQAGMVATLVIR